MKQKNRPTLTELVLKEVQKIERKCEKRGIEYLIATGCEFKDVDIDLDISVKGYVYMKDCVEIEYLETTIKNGWCYYYVLFTIEMLEKSDAEWILYLEKVKKDSTDTVKKL